MRIASYLLPLFALLILGAGCALSSADSSRQVTLEAVALKEPASEVNETSLEAETTMSAQLLAEVEPEPEEEAAPRVIEMKSGNFFFEPALIEARPGETLTVQFAGTSGEHMFVMDEVGVNEKIISGGTVTFAAPKLPGRYPYYCSLGANRTLGMEGILLVR